VRGRKKKSSYGGRRGGGQWEVETEGAGPDRGSLVGLGGVLGHDGENWGQGPGSQREGLVGVLGRWGGPGRTEVAIWQ